MLIANPIYDVVFKYLMEDTEIAQRLLSAIIGEEIIDIKLEPQEYAGRSNQFQVLIFRLDFRAIIKTAEGKRKKVLIELQKSKNAADIMRFRRYLGDNYRKEDDSTDGKSKEALPIITVYFLGFRLPKILTAALKIDRQYIDLLTGNQIDAETEFVEKLTHDSYVIQIPRLKKKVQHELERILKVFNQAYIADDSKLLKLNEKDLGDNELLKLMVNRLRKAATEEDVLRNIEIEEEVEGTIERHVRKNQELAEKNSTLSEKNNELKSELSEKDQLIERLKKQLRNQQKDK